MKQAQTLCAIAGPHIVVDHADELMIVTAPLDTMPADARKNFLRACCSIAAENDVGLRFIHTAER